MKGHTGFRIVAVTVFILFWYLAGSFPVQPGLYRPTTALAAETGPAMTPEELQAAVISYANRFISTIGQAAFQLEKEIPTPQGRLVAANRKVYSLSAVTEIAAGPSPGPALLDLVVMATLNRMVWDAYWRSQVFGSPATVMVDAFKKMEADAWALAAKVMTAEQRREFRDMIEDWFANNPGQVSVDYIRFSDFGDLGKKPNLKEIQKPGGLLAPVREATAAVDEVRMTSERAMFLLTKMQLIMGFQAELVYKQLVLQPEMNGILKDITGFRVTAERLADVAEQMPKRVAAERKAILEAIDDKATTLRKVNTDVQATLDRVNTTFTGLQQTTAGFENLLAGTRQTAVVANDLVASVDRLMARLEKGESAEPARPFDIQDYITAIEKAQATVTALNQLVVTVDRPDLPLITGLVTQFDRTAKDRIDHIFWRLVQMLLVGGVVGLVLLTVYFRLQRNISGIEKGSIRK
jgi:methyl-accepting chemotaxis protein